MAVNVINPNKGRVYLSKNGMQLDSANLDKYHPNSNVNTLQVNIEDGGVLNTMAMINYQTPSMAVQSQAMTSHWYPLFFIGINNVKVANEGGRRTFAQFLTPIPVNILNLNLGRSTPMNVKATVKLVGGVNFKGVFDSLGELQAQIPPTLELDEEYAIACVIDELGNVDYYQVDETSTDVYEWVKNSETTNPILSLLESKQYNIFNISVQGGFGNATPLPLATQHFQILWQSINNQGIAIADLDNKVDNVLSLYQNTIQSVLETPTIKPTITNDFPNGKRLELDVKVSVNNDLIKEYADGLSVEDEDIQALAQGEIATHNIDPLAHDDIRQEIELVDQKADAHIADLSNPHEVTAEQVDTYNKLAIDNKDTAIMNKANNLENANMFKDVNYNNVNGVLTFTKYDDTTKEIDLPLELIVTSGYYDEVENELVLVLANGSEIRIPVDNLLTDLDAHNIRFNGSGTNYLVNKNDVESAVKELDTQVKGANDLLEDKVDNNELAQLYGGKNLLVPDLTNKDYLGDGWYLLDDIYGLELKYNVFNGTFRIHGVKETGTSEFRFMNILANNLKANVNYMFSVVDVYNAIPIEPNLAIAKSNPIIYRNWTSIINTAEDKVESFVYTTSDFNIHFYIWSGLQKIDKYFKLQIEQGTIATPYTLPMFVTPELLDTKVNTSDIVDNLTSTDTNKPLSANQGKVLNDTTAKLAVSNVFTQPQQVPNATLPQHATNKLQVETMFEMFKHELRGYNLAMPNLTGKTEISAGVYRLYNANGITIDYNITNGEYTINGTQDGDILVNIAPIISESGKSYTSSYLYVSGTGQLTINWFSPNQNLNSAVSSLDNIVTVVSSGQTMIRFYSSLSGRVFDNFTFKLQVEKDSTATPYTVPGQIPAYKIVTGVVPNSFRVVKSGNNFNIYMSSHKDSKHIHYRYGLFVDSETNLNQWKLRTVSIVDDNYNPVYNMVLETEWEGVFRENGATDFIGGNHGNEINTHIDILLDGEVVDVFESDFTKDNVEELKIVNKSILNRRGDPTTDVAERTKVTTWKNGQMIIENKWTFLVDTLVPVFYPSMMSLKREDGNGAVSHLRSNSDYDTVLANSPNQTGGAFDNTQDATYYEMWGETTGAYFKHECIIDTSKYPARKSFATNDQYQMIKSYFDLGPMDAKIGDVVKSKSIYTITV